MIRREFVIADLHFGHEGVTRFRPEFVDVAAMEQHIIACWNSVVGKHDRVYVLGDIAFTGEGLLLCNLRGRNGQCWAITTS